LKWDIDEQNAKRDRENKTFEELIGLFLQIWHRVPEKSKGDSRTEKRFDFLLKRQIEVKKKRFEPKKSSKLGWGEVLSKFQGVVGDCEGRGEKSGFDIKSRVNWIMKKVSSQFTKEQEYSKELAYRVCVLKHFDVQVDSFLCVKAPDIQQVRDFCSFYERNKENWEEKLVPKDPGFEESMEDIRKDHFGGTSREKRIFREFSLFIFNRNLHHFSQEYMERVVYFTEEDSQQLSLHSQNCRQMLLKTLKLFENLQKKSKTDPVVRTEQEYDCVASRAEWLC
jgi:hypothetical protein